MFPCPRIQRSASIEISSYSGNMQKQFYSVFNTSAKIWAAGAVTQGENFHINCFLVVTQTQIGVFLSSRRHGFFSIVGRSQCSFVGEEECTVPVCLKCRFMRQLSLLTHTKSRAFFPLLTKVRESPRSAPPI